jgi:two-component system response regulator PilR (NtrC family)
MNKAHALVVDDEADILDLLKITLARMDVQATTAMTLGAAKHELEGGRFDLCLTDMNLPDGSGIDLVRFIAEYHPALPVAMITAHGSMESAVAAMKAGAFDFVPKPVDLQLLRRLVGSALKLRTHGGGGGEGGSAEGRSEGGVRLLGDSPKVEEIRRLIAKLARNQAPVFITGESGTGKELAARLIHAQGPRAEGNFVAVNCGAIPQDLVESELFGHRKGSFTGAVADKEGLFQAAESGTLFLDEVADLPLPAQVKLLRAIQEKSVRPVGAQQELTVDVRIISASHRDLNEEVEKGRFRQDLFYRINVIEMRMPALREHPQDILVLAARIMDRITREHPERAPMKLSDEAAAALGHHLFPGNVRELENVLERATALCDGSIIGPQDLYLPQTETQIAADPHLNPEVPLEDYLGEIERRAILKALDETRWNRTAAAKKLGMTLRALRYRLAKLGIE